MVGKSRVLFQSTRGVLLEGRKEILKRFEPGTSEIELGNGLVFVVYVAVWEIVRNGIIKCYCALWIKQISIMIHKGRGRIPEIV